MISGGVLLDYYQPLREAKSTYGSYSSRSLRWIPLQPFKSRLHGAKQPIKTYLSHLSH